MVAIFDIMMVAFKMHDSFSHYINMALIVFRKLVLKMLSISKQSRILSGTN
jgi:hypothetical protein